MIFDHNHYVLNDSDLFNVFRSYKRTVFLNCYVENAKAGAHDDNHIEDE